MTHELILALLANAQVQATPAPSPSAAVSPSAAPVPAVVQPRPAPQKGDVARERICDAAERVDKNQQRLEREREYAKVGGMVDREKIYRFSRGVVEGRHEGQEAMRDFRTETGREFTGADLLKCPYFSE